jgi:hypothetical protein
MQPSPSSLRRWLSPMRAWMGRLSFILLLPGAIGADSMRKTVTVVPGPNQGHIMYIYEPYRCVMGRCMFTIEVHSILSQ